jgi:hypothetical protein
MLLNISSQTKTDSINAIIQKIDSLRFSNLTKTKLLEDRSICGGRVNGDYFQDSLVHLYSILGVELYTSITRVYYDCGIPIRIYYYESIPQWDKFNQNPENDTIEDWEEILNRMTFKETATVFYISATPEMFNIVKGKEVHAETDEELLSKVMICIETMKNELIKQN